MPDVIPHSDKKIKDRNAQKRRLRINEASIALMGRLAASAPFDQNLLLQTPANDMSSMIAHLVERLQSINIKRIAQKQSFLARLTGADLEAKLKFEVEVRQLTLEMRKLTTKKQ